MSQTPNDLFYAQSHEWVRIDENGVATIGITDHAQTLLGDLVFVELPEPEDTLSAGDEFGVVESVKTASDVYAPVSGEVIAINEDLQDAPENVNNDAYGDGWLVQVKMSDKGELENLLSAEEYEQYCESEED